MAKELVVREFLSDPMIDAGKKLIERLDKLQSQVCAVFWVLLDEDRRWRLMIISPLVEDEGPKKLYGHIIEINKDVDKNESIISLHDITVSDVSNVFYQSLKQALSTDKNDISDIRFSKNMIGNTFFEDVYIYRMA